MADETKDFSSAEKSLDEVLAECIVAEEAGAGIDREALLRQHPHLAAELREFLANRDRIQRLAEPLQGAAAAGRRSGHLETKLRYFGDYELLEEVAVGGMGIVYKARQVSLNRIVAVKMILKGTLASEDDVKRFRAEAEAAANLQHPGIVAIHEVGLHEGQHYFSMDFVEGQSLAQLPREQPLPASQAAEYVRDAAEAVHYAHQQGTLHRDLKPSNILIDRQGRVRITDFGLAKRIEGQSDLTLTGQILGTPSYMPPEQALCKRSLIGTASDVYSLGAVLYELLAGRPPFRGESPAETLRQVESLDAVSPRLLNPATPRDLETICLKCLEKEPHKRYATAQHLAEDLGRYLRGEPIHARPTLALQRGLKWIRRHPTVTGLAVMSMVALLALMGIAVAQTYNSRLHALNEQLTGAKTSLENRNKQLSNLNVALETAKTSLQASNRDLANASENLELALTDAKSERANARRFLYAARMALVERAEQQDQPVRVVQILRSVVPESADQDDLRDFEWHQLWRKYRGERYRLRGHIGPVTSVAFSPDGRLLASASADKTVRLWDCTMGLEVSCLKGHSAGVTRVAFSHDGKRLASGSTDRLVKIWDTQTAEEQFSLKGHSGSVTSVAFSPNGRLLCSGSEDKSVRVWDAVTGEIAYQFGAHTGPVNGVAFSPDSSRIASIGGTELLVWECLTGNVLVRSKEWPSKDVGRWTGVAFNATGELLALGRISGDPYVSIVEIREVNTGRVVHSWTGHTRTITDVAFSADNNRLISSSTDSTLKVYDTVSGKEAINFYEESAALCVAFSSDGHRIASGSEDQTVKVWETRAEEPRTFFHRKTQINNVAFSPDGSRLAAAIPFLPIIWDVATGQSHGFGRMRTTNWGRVAWSPDGTQIAIGRTIMDAATQQSHRLSLEDFGLQSIGPQLEGTGTAFSNDGQRLAAVVGAHTVGIWDATSWRCLHVLSEAPLEPFCLAFSPSGRLLAIGGGTLQRDSRKAGKLQVWDLESLQVVLDLEGYHDVIFDVRFSPDGTQLAAGSGVERGVLGASVGEVRIWDVASGREVFVFRGHCDRIYSIAFSPNGKRLVAAGGRSLQRPPGEATIWDLTTGQEVWTTRDELASFYGVAFSPSGKLVATASRDGNVKIWDGTPLSAPLSQPFAECD